MTLDEAKALALKESREHVDRRFVALSGDEYYVVTGADLYYAHEDTQVIEVAINGRWQ